MRRSRREFLSKSVEVGGGVLAATIGAERCVAGIEKKWPPILDTHQHLWNLKKFRLSWTKDVPPLAKNFLMADYLQAAKGLGVTKTIYMEVDVEASQQVAEAEHVLELCRHSDNPMVGAVISGRPESPKFKSYLRRYRDDKYVKGVRRILHPPELPGDHCMQKTFVDNVRLLGEWGFSFDICIRATDLINAAKLTAACPDTQFILDHCGNPQVGSTDMAKWRADITKVAENPNIVCKISGFIASLQKDKWKPKDLAPVIQHVYSEFGAERVVFGSDWPVCNLAANYRGWVTALRSIVNARTDKEKRQLFYDNAARIYKVST